MQKKSAGILLYRLKKNTLEIFLVHPGGPFWKNKDAGVWSVPKGEFADDEEGLAAAKREFKEETGIAVTGHFTALTPVRLKSGKIVYAWALEKDIPADHVKSNFFEMEWPPKSGKKQQFPEIDKGEWFSVQQAKEKIHPQQVAFIDELVAHLGL